MAEVAPNLLAVFEDGGYMQAQVDESELGHAVELLFGSPLCRMIATEYKGVPYILWRNEDGTWERLVARPPSKRNICTVTTLEQLVANLPH